MAAPVRMAAAHSAGLPRNATGTNEFECKKCKVRSETKASDHPCLPNENHDFFARNNRRISALSLSPGQCAAVCFLMGCSATPSGDEPTDEVHSDDYRNMCPPKEDVLNWSLWDRARSFWTGLAGDRGLIPVRTALNQLTISKPGNDDNQGLGGRIDEKLALLTSPDSDMCCRPRPAATGRRLRLTKSTSPAVGGSTTVMSPSLST